MGQTPSKPISPSMAAVEKTGVRMVTEPIMLFKVGFNCREYLATMFSGDMFSGLDTSTIHTPVHFPRCFVRGVVPKGESILTNSPNQAGRRQYQSSAFVPDRMYTIMNGKEIECGDAYSCPSNSGSDSSSLDIMRVGTACRLKACAIDVPGFASEKDADVWAKNAHHVNWPSLLHETGLTREELALNDKSYREPDRARPIVALDSNLMYLGTDGSPRYWSGD